ncbi:hypothetical protein ACQKIE_19155 [Luteibacter sp. NPDC031894]|uniref:hypothetical protein n=1 Tax=Luteibacter sp. NPDC031894 TaxID=3390572 RepID=UPI003D09460D
MNQIVQFQPAVEAYGARSLTAADVRAHVNLMQDVMLEVMKDGTHFGTIPGTKSKSLYKAGAEKLMATFRLAAKPEVEDLSQNGEVAYRVTVNLLSPNGSFVGAGIGECSSHEDKYAWRAAICDEEFDLTPENRRRVKFSKYQGKVEKKKQVRTNPADVANTILKMAKKRAQVDAVITATAASDIFTQDIEDLPEEVVAEIVGRQPSKVAQAVQQAIPEDSPERDAAIERCKTAAAKGTDSFRTFWKDEMTKAERELVKDKVSMFQSIANSADEMLADQEGNA